MYLRETHQKRADGSVITHLQLGPKSVWNPDKGRSETRILYNCGRAEDPEVTERLRRLAKSILRRASPDSGRGNSGYSFRGANQRQNAVP